MAQLDVAVVIGSPRKESFTRKLMVALAAVAPPGLKLDIVDIGNLPLYNQDLDANPPAEWGALKERIKKADGVIFATPEHNRSVPAPLKNALDAASRPYGQSAWSGKPAAVISVSPGAMGGFGANHHLRQSLVFLNMPILQQPEAYVDGPDKLVDAEGKITNPGTKDFLVKFLTEFETFIKRHPKA